MIDELITKNRSYRKFYQNEKIQMDTLKSLVNLARLTPSGGNLQPLKYMIYNDNINNEKIFNCLTWAKYLKTWKGPEEGEKPSAYIIILGDKTISENFGYDPGIAGQSILLGAVEKGYGGCLIGNINKTKLQEEFQIKPNFEIILVIALGKPKEKIILEELKESQSIEYWRDENNVHHVPKRKLDVIIL
jgi:nitroreductase